MNYTISRVDVVRYPVVRVTFNDGFSGDYDFTDLIARGPVFEPLNDPGLFGQVAVAPDGHTFGWFLDDEGNELDFCPDATRIQLETRAVEELAAHHRARQSAAE